MRLRQAVALPPLRHLWGIIRAAYVGHLAPNEFGSLGRHLQNQHWPHQRVYSHPFDEWFTGIWPYDQSLRFASANHRFLEDWVRFGAQPTRSQVFRYPDRLRPFRTLCPLPHPLPTRIRCGRHCLHLGCSQRQPTHVLPRGGLVLETEDLSLRGSPIPFYGGRFSRMELLNSAFLPR